MSGGFCLVLERHGRPIDRELLTALAGSLSHRGPDGGDQWVEGPLGVACQYFWTVPEDRGSRQPLRHPDGRRWLLWDGRIDNRAELASALGIDPQAAAELSDAALVLRAYERWDDDSWERLLGPFVAAVCEPAAGKVTLVRDPIGDRSLFFHLADDRLVAASEEQAVLAAGIEPRLDLAYAARHLALSEPTDGSTFFAGVTELLPGHRLAVTPGGSGERRWWSADPEPRLSGSDAELGERFRELLSRAVTARLRSTTTPVLQLSGGLDSSSIAALSADAGHSLVGLSWVFSELEACDEREYMRPLIDRFGIEWVHLPSDDCLPFQDLDRWPVNPNAPEESVFRPLVQRMYRAAGERHSRVMLTGLYGDNLFLGGERWWLDLVRSRRFGDAAGEGWRRTMELGPARFLWRHAIGPILPRWVRERRRRAPPQWLTAEAQSRSLAATAWPPSMATAERPAQHQRVLSLMNGRATVSEHYHLRRSRLDLRNPFRDRRLVEFMLAVPAYLLERGAQSKAVLRRGLVDLLPPRIRDRRDKTSFAELYRRGMSEQHRRELWRRLLQQEGFWGKVVQRHWLRDMLWGEVDSRQALVVSRCVFLGHWARRVGISPCLLE